MRCSERVVYNECCFCTANRGHVPWSEISFLKKCVGLSSGWQIKISIFHSQIFASTFQMEYFNKTWQSGLRCQLDFLHWDCLDADLSLLKSRSQTYFSPETWWTFILTFQASNNSPPVTQQQKEFLVDFSENLGEYNCYLRGIYCRDKYHQRSVTIKSIVRINRLYDDRLRALIKERNEKNGWRRAREMFFCLLLDAELCLE